MADLVITAASVLRADNNSTVYNGTAGGTITAGMVVYQDSADSELKATDADAAATATVKGIALHGASDGQPLQIITEGNLTLNAVLTKGVVYYMSTTAGGIAPVADLAAGDYISVLGVATSTTNLYVKIINSGVTL